MMYSAYPVGKNNAAAITPTHSANFIADDIFSASKVVRSRVKIFHNIIRVCERISHQRQIFFTIRTRFPAVHISGKNYISFIGAHWLVSSEPMKTIFGHEN